MFCLKNSYPQSVYYLNYIIFLILCVSCTQCFNVDNKHSTEQITSSIITHFVNHNVIFHYDDTTKWRMDLVIRHVKIKGFYIMHNYSTCKNLTTFKRPTGYKFIHVVFFTHYAEFKNYTYSSAFNLAWDDVLLFVTNLNNTDLKTKNITVWPSTQLAGAIFVLNAKSLNLYYICYLCGDLSTIPQILYELKDFSGNNHTFVYTMLEIYNKRFKNFNRHIFNVGYIQYKPFFWCNIIESDENHTLFDLMGSEGELLVLLHEKLNLEFYMKPFDYYANVWVDLIKSVANYSLTWAVGGITLTIGRAEIVDFTSAINTEPFTILYSVYDDPWMSWQSVILPFELTIWLVLFGTMLIISTIIYVTINKTRTENNINFYYCMQGCMRLLVDQPLPFIRPVLKSRFTAIWLMFLWFIVAQIITNAYKSKLTSALINSKTNEPDTIDELVDLGYDFQINNIDSSVIKENLKSSQDHKFLTALDRSNSDLDFCLSVLKTIRSKVAVIDEETNIQFTVQNECRKLLTTEEHDDLRLIHNILFPSDQAWPMRINSPIRMVFNKIISILRAAGIINKWNSQYATIATMISKSHQDQNLHSTHQRYFILTTMIGPAIIWIFGMVAATIAFIVELIMAYNYYPK